MVARPRPHVLFISYNSLIEPLGPTQIVPYVRELAQVYRMSILSFEKTVRTPEEDARARDQLASELQDSGITWVRCQYHRRLSLLATLFDIACGLASVVRMHRRNPLELVHARGYVPGAIAWGVGRLINIPYVFDVRGLQAEEYADAKHWSPSGARFRLTKLMEQQILRDAGGLVTLTETIRPVLQQFPGLTSRSALPPWKVIPCCVDLEHFKFSAIDRQRIRDQLGVGDRPVLVYAGSIGTWYLLDEMLQFVQAARQARPDVFFLMLCNESSADLQSTLDRHGFVEGRDVATLRASFAEMPQYLSAADAGIAFIQPCLSKQSSSPTKCAEYLACGLPLVVNRGIGDVDILIREQQAGVLVSEFTREAYSRAAKQLCEQLARPRHEFRQVAVEQFSLKSRAYPAYRQLYASVLSQQSTRRVLFVTPYPMHCAPSQRLKFEQYYAHFEAQGIQVVVSPFVCAALWRVLYERGHVLKKVVLVLYGYLRRVWDCARAGRFDAVYLHLWAVPFGPPWFEEVLSCRGIRMVYDIDDLIYLPQASEANAFVTRFRKKEERITRIMRATDHVITSTDYLRRVALQHNPCATYISSTIDTNLYYPRSHSDERRSVTIGWTGSHSTSRYVHLLTPVLRELARRYDIRVLVVGDHHFSMSGVPIEARPWSLIDETSNLAEMDMGVYPLPDEEWVMGKSGLKALQYMGMGVPVVASAIGAASEFIEDGVNGFLARDPDEWLDRLSRLIEHPELREQLGGAGRATVEQRFSVTVTGPVYQEILESVMQRPSEPAVTHI